MRAVSVHDREALARFLLQRREVNFYTLGDLDDFFWPYTVWYALKDDEGIQAVALIYTGIHPPVLLAIENDNRAEMRALLDEVLPLLPRRIYAHLSLGLDETLSATYTLDHHGKHYKMALTNPSALEAVDTAQVQRLGPDDLENLNALYEVSYPGNWFDPRMLETGQYFGIRAEGGELVSAAGIHVYSPVYRVAAIGNITSRPDRRGEGLGTAVTAALCKNLLKTVDVIGLNVKMDNLQAIHVYEKLGFKAVARYNEFMLEGR